MKRVGNLWPAVIERGNLLRAFHQAARGRRRKEEVRRFAENLDGNLERLRGALLTRTFETGHFHVFTIRDPKERTIHAARFPERVFHHALMNLCEPVLERRAVFHSYACRIGKGRMKAIDVAQKAARGRAWYLKLDIRKYFESIPHDRLLKQLDRVFKDAEVMHWLGKIICCHRRAVGKGLPIGSLTSQHMANFYLGALDQFCQSRPAVRAYCRYMDDFVCWADDKAALIAAGRDIRDFVQVVLGLELKHPPCPQRTARGMDFLGYRVFPNHCELNRSSKKRYRRQLLKLEALREAGGISESVVQQRLTALSAFVLPVRSHGYRRRVLETIRPMDKGLEPGATGRQLEQQREQLPSCQPQQQQPDQQQQQPGLPHRPQLGPTEVDASAVSMGPNRPSARSWCLWCRDKCEQSSRPVLVARRMPQQTHWAGRHGGWNPPPRAGTVLPSLRSRHAVYAFGISLSWQGHFQAFRTVRRMRDTIHRMTDNFSKNKLHPAGPLGEVSLPFSP